MRRSLYAFILLILSAQLVSLYGQRQTERLKNEVTNNISEQIVLYPQEKIHLHIDRDFYVPGENIWFKAYLVDASTHKFPTESRYVYVELIDSVSTLVDRVMVKPDDTYNMHYGNIFLSEVIPQGYYTIRAYTKDMENQEDGYFFSKLIRIGNIPGSEENVSPRSSGTRSRRERDDFAVSFFPEGGNLPAGTLNRIAFKAVNTKGLAEYVYGELFDDEGTALCPINTFHAGMGTFSFIPEAGKEYYAVLKNANGESKRFTLPKATRGSYSLTTSYWRDGKLKIGRIKAEDISRREQMYLLIHNKGAVLHFDTWDETSDYLVLNQEELPSGVLQIMLFDRNMNPLSERLVFSKNIDQAHSTLQTDKDKYKTREKVSAKLKVTDFGNFPLYTSLSVSVVDDKDQAVDNSVSILSSLLLSSELKGHIEDPHYYFKEDSEETTLALDYLMMTQGWRRYDISKAIKGQYAQPSILPEKEKSISGTLKHPLTGRPIAKGRISLLSTNGDFATVETEKDGTFVIEGLEYPANTSILIQSVNNKANEYVQLTIEPEAFPDVKALQHNPSSLTFNPQKELNISLTPITADAAFLEKATERAKYDDDMRIINLDVVEVVATAPGIEPKRSIYSSDWAYSASSILIEELNALKSQDVLLTLPGVRYTPGGGIVVCAICGYPAVYIDDVYMGVAEPDEIVFGEIAFLNIIPVEHIAYIEVFKPLEAGVFGFQGINGVISITTKRTVGNKTISPVNRQKIVPLGYLEPEEFYSPVYETEAQKFDIKPDYRTTIYWQPDLTTNAAGEATFEFYTADFTTTYSVIIEGVSIDGHIVRYTDAIIVE